MTPTGATRACAGCGEGVDSLRAPAVAASSAGIAYFCGELCRLAWTPEVPGPAPTSPTSTAAVEPMAPVSWSLPEACDDVGDALATPQAPVTPPLATSDAPPAAPRASASDFDGLLLGVAGGAGALALAMSLLGSAPAVTTARVGIVIAGAAAFFARATTAARDPVEPHPLLSAVAPVGLALAALGARVGGLALAAEFTSVAGVVLASSAALAALRQRTTARLEAERAWIARALSMPARRVHRSDAVIVAAHEIRAGERIRVHEGEIVPADLLVASAAATVLPWLGATATTTVRQGDHVVAGARVVRGAVEGQVVAAGGDRALSRLSLDPARRLDVSSSLGKIARAVAEVGGVVALGVTVLSRIGYGARASEMIVAGLATLAALFSPLTSALPAAHLSRGLFAAQRRGITYASSDAFDGAAEATAAVFLPRGTLLLGAPEVVEVEPAADGVDPDRLLAWVAGLHGDGGGVAAQAVARAARERTITPDPVRSVARLPGLGARGVASDGSALLVGSRALLLEARVSMALFEQRVLELEGLGRTVLLVARAGRLAGLIGLQDGLRPGARAAVQHLFDAGVEPVLLTSEARESCESVARALDVSHVRPEVLPEEQPAEITRLREAGAKVAVIARPDLDAATLDAATVPVALGAGGAHLGDAWVGLVGDDARDAALSLAIARRARGEATVGLLLSAVPGAVAAVAVGVGLLPPLFAPLAGMVGGAAAAAHLHATRDRDDLLATPWDLALPPRPGGS